LNNHLAHLFYLIWFGQTTSRLKVENFGDLIVNEDVMASVDSFSKAEPAKEASKIGETDVPIAGAAQDLQKNRISQDI
jgi:hypothetical protein